MRKLVHYALCPFSRSARLALGELGLEAEFAEERPWERRREFMLLNAAGTLPVLIDGEGAPVCGAGPVAEYLSECFGADELFPGGAAARAETRRLVEWFNVKFAAEVSGPILHEKIHRRFMAAGEGGGPPRMETVRAGAANLRHHLSYIGYLVNERNWLAGDTLTHADLTAAAHLSCIDYLGDVPWSANDAAKDWYARIKSRPSFRPLVADRLPGMPPPPAYADLDF